MPYFITNQEKKRNPCSFLLWLLLVLYVVPIDLSMVLQYQFLDSPKAIFFHSEAYETFFIAICNVKPIFSKCAQKEQ